MLLIPEAWQNNELMEPEKKAFYRWAVSCVSMLVRLDPPNV